MGGLDHFVLFVL